MVVACVLFSLTEKRASTAKRAEYAKEKRRGNGGVISLCAGEYLAAVSAENWWAALGIYATGLPATRRFYYELDFGGKKKGCDMDASQTAHLRDFSKQAATEKNQSILREKCRGKVGVERLTVDVR
jgi:hypothetical protein